MCSLFCLFNLILVELWSICYWPIYLWTFMLCWLFFRHIFPHCLCVSWTVLYFQICHIPAAPLSHLLFVLFPCIPYWLPLMGGFCCWVCVCCFGSHLLCCFVSVKSATDVDLFSLNTLILLIERLWCSSQGADGGYGPTSGSTYDIRFMVSKMCKQTDFC